MFGAERSHSPRPCVAAANARANKSIFASSAIDLLIVYIWVQLPSCCSVLVHRSSIQSSSLGPPQPERLFLRHRCMDSRGAGAGRPLSAKWVATPCQTVRGKASISRRCSGSTAPASAGRMGMGAASRRAGTALSRYKQPVAQVERLFVISFSLLWSALPIFQSLR